jgi:hypothetical protein
MTSNNTGEWEGVLQEEEHAERQKYTLNPVRF